MSLPSYTGHWLVITCSALTITRIVLEMRKVALMMEKYYVFHRIEKRFYSLITEKLFWECGKMSMENVEIFSCGNRSLSTESSPPPFQRLQANQIVPLTCIRLVFFIPLLHICFVFFIQYFSRH